MIMNRMFSEMKFYSINFVHFFPQQGIRLISGLIDEYSLEVIQAYMAHIQVWDISIILSSYCIAVASVSRHLHIT